MTSVFLPVAQWLVSCLATIGGSCRKLFTTKALALLEQPVVPAHVKVAWNDAHAALLASRGDEGQIT